MKAVLLSAGFGTRLRPLTKDVPKILVPFRGRPLLEHQIEYLARNGVTEVAINAHHLVDAVTASVALLNTPVRVRVSVEDELLGTAGALRPLCNFLDETFVVLYGDVVTEAPLEALFARHRSAGAVATLAYYHSCDIVDKGWLRVDGQGRIRDFVEKPTRARVDGAVSAGLYALEPEVVDLVREGDDFGIDIWPRLILEGRALYAHELDMPVVDVGTPEALRLAETMATR